MTARKIRYVVPKPYRTLVVPRSRTGRRSILGEFAGGKPIFVSTVGHARYAARARFWVLPHDSARRFTRAASWLTHSSR